MKRIQNTIKGAYSGDQENGKCEELFITCWEKYVFMCCLTIVEKRCTKSFMFQLQDMVFPDDASFIRRSVHGVTENLLLKICWVSH